MLHTQQDGFSNRYRQMHLTDLIHETQTTDNGILNLTVASS